MASTALEMDDAYMEDTFDQPLAAQSAPKASGGGKKGSTSVLVVVDEAHPFDLEGYLSSYDHDRPTIKRLQYIASCCPGLAVAALSKAIDYALEGKDTTQYQTVLTQYNNIANQKNSVAGKEVVQQRVIDTEWVEKTNAKAIQEKEKLDVELKMYTGNMIKESIRMGHNDLGHFYRSHGDHATALRHYTKSREFCTSSQHVVDMCLNILELLLEEQNYAHVSTYVFKAEAALDTNAYTTASDKKKPSGNTTVGGVLSEKEKIQSRLDLAMALSLLGQGNYDSASWAFIKISRGLEGWERRVASPSDIAIYGTLCALATFERRQLKSAILENEGFQYYLEQEPYMRDILDAYMSSKFRQVLSLLDRYSARMQLDNLLGSHVSQLVRLIRDRALVLYFGPFASIRLDSLADAFGLGVAEVEKAIVGLIQEGRVKGRVDSHNKILKAKDLDHRTELFLRATKAGQDISSANRKLLYRLRLQEADVVIKAPKSAQLEFMGGGYGPGL